MHKASNMIEAKAMLKEAYELDYGIFDYIEQNKLEKKSPELQRPFASIEVRECEDNSKFDPFLFAAKKYSTYKIKDRYGLDLMEFLSLPHSSVELLYEYAGIALDLELKKQAEVVKNLG